VTNGDEPGTPPYRLRTERLVIRCWHPRDAPLLREAIDSSLEELRPWMPWAREEPKPLPDTVHQLRRFRGAFDLGQDYFYGVLSADESQVVGGTGLHTRVGADAFEIGYWIRTGWTGAGLATEVAAALTRVAFALCGADRLEIHVDPANTPSCRIPQKLGYTQEATLRRRLSPMRTGEPRRDEAVFSLLAAEFASSPLADFPVEAYDSTDARLL
jgi:RimJ/RimL family protein N-acetyltransferase